MMLSITKVIHNIGEKKFRKMLREGCFPKVNYEEYPGGHSYSMFDYSDTWAAFMKVLDGWMKETGLDRRLGVFTRKHSAQFLADVEKLAEHITETNVYDVMPERFHSFADSVRDYASNMS